MKNKPKQYGFIEPVIVPEDYFFGSKKLGSVVLNEKGDWRDYLPIFEHQRKSIESNSCVSFGIASALEMLHKLHYKTEPNYSDRYISKTSETDPDSGNTPKRVAAAVREHGTVPEKEWPFVDNLEEYFKEIPQRLIDMGMEWLNDYSFGYEWSDQSQLKEALKRSPVGVAVSAWQQNEAGEYIHFGRYNHWVVLVAFDEQDRGIIFDSYEESLKTMVEGYEFGFPQIYVLSRKKKAKPSWFKKLWLWLKSYISDLFQ